MTLQLSLVRGDMAHAMMSFLAELKRRNVYKVAVAYLVAAWLLIQAASIFLPAFDAPAWVIRAVIIFLIVGFPVVLALSWAFEITPEGIKLESEVARSESITRNTGRKIVGVTIVLAVIAAGLLAYQFLRPKETAPSETRAEATSPHISEKSIAVLPFANLSHDPDNAYFAAGIQDEIITRLAKIGDLNVISCTSTQRFKDSTDIPGVARQLGVANVLEGSIQRTSDKVRVNVQLIKGATDTHLWADTFDRELTDIFEVESEIAKTVAETLQAKLTGSEQTAITNHPTENSEAHQLYLRGRFFWNKRTGENLNKAADYFNQAIAIDPKYALAYVGLADAYVLMPLYGAGVPKDSYPKARAAVEKALALDDTLAEAHTSMGQVSSYSLDYARAIPEYERGIQLNPNYATGHQWYGSSGLIALGRTDDAIKQVKRGLELDPLSLVINTDLGSTYYRSHRYDQAIAQLHKTIDLDPGFYYAHWNLGSALAASGQIGPAIEEYKKARALNDDPSMLGLLGRAYAVSGNKQEAIKIRDELEAVAKQRYVSGYSFALVYLGLGDKEGALRWLEKAYEDGAGETLRYIQVDPILDPLRNEPRFKALVAKVFPPTPK